MPSAKRYYSWDEVRKSVPDKVSTRTVSMAESSLFVIKNKVYNISGPEFSAWHPGGSVALTQIGLDATGAFEGFHEPESWLKLHRFCVGEIHPNEIKELTDFEKDIQKVREDIKKRGLDKPNFSYYSVIIAITLSLITSSLTILYIAPDTVISVIISSFLLGIAFQQSGWLAHDICHHQIFKNRRLNTLSGYFAGNVLQGFSVGWWKQKHCTHHAAPNVHEYDPDIDTLPFLAWSEHALEGFTGLEDEALEKLMVRYQHFTIFPLLTLARLSWAISSILWNASSDKELVFPAEVFLERLSLGIHYLWYLGSGLLLLSPFYAAIWAIMAQLFCGCFLSLVFTLNHVFF